MEKITTIEQLEACLLEEDKQILMTLLKKAEAENQKRFLEEEIARLQEHLKKLQSGEVLFEIDELIETKDQADYELKIGEIVKTKMRAILESPDFSCAEVQLLQSKEYSKEVFDLNFSLLNKDPFDCNGYRRYYKTPIYIRGEKFFLCSQWYKGQMDYLEKWISKHQ